MPDDIEDKILKYLQEYKKKERKNQLEFVGPSTISKHISTDETKVLEICDKLRRRGIIVEATVSTEYGNRFGYKIKPLSESLTLNVSREDALGEEIRQMHEAYNEMD